MGLAGTPPLAPHQRDKLHVVKIPSPGTMPPARMCTSRLGWKLVSEKRHMWPHSSSDAKSLPSVSSLGRATEAGKHQPQHGVRTRYQATSHQFKRGKLQVRALERWQSGRMRRFAKPLYGLTPVPRVRIPPSPPHSLDCRQLPLASRRKVRTMPVFRDYSQTNRTAENGLLGIECSTVPALLRKAHEQSGFEEGVRRMQCDQRPGIPPQRVDFCPRLGHGVWGVP